MEDGCESALEPAPPFVAAIEEFERALGHAPEDTRSRFDGHIRKYDGAPFMPHHVVDGVLEHLAGKTDRYVPFQEIMV